METTEVIVADICEEWLDMKRLLIKESTFAKYYSIVKRHIEPEVGQIQLDNVNSSLINKFIYQKMKSGNINNSGELGAKTVRDISTILKSIVKYAETEYHINGLAGNAVLPKKPRMNLEILNQEELKKLESYIDKNPEEPRNTGLLLCLYTGLRLGEICALRWQDIDFKKGIIKVTHTMQRIAAVDIEGEKKTRIIIDDPKSNSSYRTIPISKKLSSIINEAWAESYQEEFFLTNSLRYIEPRNYQYFFKRVLAKSGIRDVNFHILRHTFATRCVEAGFDVKTLSEILGHADTSITLNYYIHSSLENKRRQMELLEL